MGASYRRVSRRFLLTLTIFWVVILVMTVIHFVQDVVDHSLSHMIYEMVLMTLSVGGAAFLGQGWVETQGALIGARSELKDRSRERDAWKQQAKAFQAGVAKAIDEQMEEWHLTPTEKNITLFLLKGLSHKEIAQITDRSERTIRQHAVDVYRKSDLGGRAELAAYFLEDLLVPEEEL